MALAFACFTFEPPSSRQSVTVQIPRVRGALGVGPLNDLGQAPLECAPAAMNPSSELSP